MLSLFKWSTNKNDNLFNIQYSMFCIKIFALLLHLYFNMFIEQQIFEIFSTCFVVCQIIYPITFPVVNHLNHLKHVNKSHSSSNRNCKNEFVVHNFILKYYLLTYSIDIHSSIILIFNSLNSLKLIFKYWIINISRTLIPNELWF